MPEDPPTTFGDGDPVVRWGLGDAAAGWLIAQVGGAMALAVVLTANGADRQQELPLSWFAIGQLGLWVPLLGVPLAVAWLKGHGPVHDFGLWARWRDLPVGVGWGAIAQVVLIPVVYVPIFLLFGLDTEELREPAQEVTDRATDTFGIVLLVLIVGLAAPVVEEVFYRGLLQRAAIRRFGTWPGVIGTAVIFGVVHFQLLQLPALVVFGLVAGVLTLRSGRLGPAIAAHIAFNMTTVVGLVWLV